MLIGSKTKIVPKPRKLVIVTDIVPRLCIGEHLHHDRPVRHDLLRRHQLPIANTDSERSLAECLRSTWAHFGTTWMSFIPVNHYQSSDYSKHSKPGYPKKHRTWLSAFYATIRVSTTYTTSLLASCSSFFCSHVNLFLTFPWAKVRNRWKRVNT